MKDEIRKNLIDIIQAGEEIQQFTHDMDFKTYRNSPITQRAVERNFEIIGEALNRIKRMDDKFLARVSGHNRIIGFRNILIHGYDIIDEMIVWKAVEDHLPTLLKEIQMILNA